MPLNVLRNLIERAERLGDWRARLAGNPTLLTRLEVAFETYLEARGEIFANAANFSEMKGVQAGLKLAGPKIRAQQEGVKRLIADGGLEAEHGKCAVLQLAKVADAVLSDVDSKREEMMRHAGRIDGLSKIGNSAIDKIETAVANLERQERVAEDDEEDWSGRGTANGQRPVGSGAELLEAAGLEAPKKNGAKKKATRKKAAKKATRKKASRRKPAGAAEEAN